MQIKVVLGGVEYTGEPLTLDALDAFAKAGPSVTDAMVLKLWLQDEATQPKPEGPVRAFPIEASKAVQAILGLSGLNTGEAEAGPKA